MVPNLDPSIYKVTLYEIVGGGVNSSSMRSCLLASLVDNNEDISNPISCICLDYKEEIVSDTFFS